MNTFSIFTNIRSVVPYATVSIEDIIPIMQSEQLRQMTDAVRTASTSTEKQERKGLLPYITVNGIFSQRNNASLVKYSGLTAVDFDHIPDEDMSNVKKVLGNDPHSLFGFVSPSGNGLKIIIRHDNTSPALHDLLYPQFIYYYRELLGIPYVDTSVKDVARATYLAYNPEPYYNPHALIFHLDASLVEPVRDSKRPASSTNQTVPKGTVPMTNMMREKNRLYQMTWRDKTLMDYIQRHQWNRFPEDFEEGNRNNSLLRKARQLCLCGVDYNLALEKLLILYTRAGLSETDIEGRVGYAYLTNQVSFGLERSKWLQRRNEGQTRRDQLRTGIWPQ